MASSQRDLKLLNGHNGGRPTVLTKALANLICSTVANSDQSLPKLCQIEANWPSYDTIIHLCERKPWFKRMLWEAREKQADFLAQDTINVARETYESAGNMVQVQAAKLVCENTRWYAGKVLKRLYGENESTVNVDARTAVVVGDEQLKELRSRLSDARKLVRNTDGVEPSEAPGTGKP